MVTQNLAVAEKSVPETDYPFAGEPHDNADDTYLEGLLNEHGAFGSPDELEEFLRNFDGGEVDEAVLQTQGTDDIGGEPLDTVH